jgi:hypothetical protein
MNSLAKIQALPSTLDQIAKFVSGVKDEALSGDYNVLHVLIQLRAAQKALEILNQDQELLDAASKEYGKYGEKTVDLGGVKITSQEVGVKYDFSGCNDPEWSLYQSDEKFANDHRKEREKFLKGVTGSFTLIEEQSGETFVINPPCKTSKTTLAITLK